MDILIVDDNRDVAHSLARLLRLSGHQVSITHSGKGAIDAASRRPEAVILDIGLPDMNGREVARAIRAQAPSIVIVALSGYVSDDDGRDAREAAIDAHLTKPALLADIEAALAAHSKK